MQILLLLLCLKIRANIKVEVGQTSNIEKSQDQHKEYGWVWAVRFMASRNILCAVNVCFMIIFLFHRQGI